MVDFLSEFLARSAVMLPVIVLVSAAAWWIAGKLGLLKPERPFDPADMRTWTLVFAIGDAAIFGLVFALAATLADDTQLSTSVAAGLAAAVAIGIVPLIGRTRGK